MKDDKYRILVVDDEKDICSALEFLLKRRGYQVDVANDGATALEMIRRNAYDLMVTDLKMEKMDGLELIRRSREISEDLITVMMTAYASVESAVEAMRLGASDYIVKPFVNEDVTITVRRLLEHKRVLVENEALRRQLSQVVGARNFIGDSPSLRRIMDLLEKVIPTKSNILVLGESGTGKGMIAEVVHYGSPRRDKPFMSINCSAIPETLLESELFGYRKGAFTGASGDKTGLLVMADEGTLFLDEIGDMPLAIQAKVLKVLETGEVLPLGDTRVRKIDVRVIAATNKDIARLISEKLFREDLYYRLNVFEITLPALRERPEDLRILAHHFAERFASEAGKKGLGISEEALQAMLGYPWPGNVRELRNVIERAVVLCQEDQIRVEDLPDKVREHEALKGQTLKDLLNNFERQVILDALDARGWNKEKTALALDVDVATLYRKMKKLGIGLDKA